MIEKEYIIVGLGIGGICMCEKLIKQGKTFVVFDDGAEGATAKSGGIFNPTVLKRFNAAWNASEFFPVATSFYKNLGLKLNYQIFEPKPVLRIFKSVEEQNNWTVASDKMELRQFLSSNFQKNINPCIEASLGFGEVMGTAQIKAEILLREYRKYLLSKEVLIQEKFQYEKLNIQNEQIGYKNLSAKKIIFCEGAKSIENPFFPKEALIANKGEYLIIKAPTLQLDKLLKGPLYIIPLENDAYKVGATYKRDDFKLNTTETAKQEILSKLKSFIKCPFEVVSQTAGIRPTTKDHKPLLGSLNERPNIVFFNGLGSRGFLMAPLLSKIIFDFLEYATPIPKEMDIQRML